MGLALKKVDSISELSEGVIPEGREMKDESDFWYMYEDESIGMKIKVRTGASKVHLVFTITGKAYDRYIHRTLVNYTKENEPRREVFNVTATDDFGRRYRDFMKELFEVVTSETTLKGFNPMEALNENPKEGEAPQKVKMELPREKVVLKGNPQ